MDSETQSRAHAWTERETERAISPQTRQDSSTVTKYEAEATTVLPTFVSALGQLLSRQPGVRPPPPPPPPSFPRVAVMVSSVFSRPSPVCAQAAVISTGSRQDSDLREIKSALLEAVSGTDRGIFGIPVRVPRPRITIALAVPTMQNNRHRVCHFRIMMQSRGPTQFIYPTGR